MLYIPFQGAFYGIILGHCLGVSRLIVELVHPAPPCGEPDLRPDFLTKLHYSYFVQLQLVFTAIAITVISYFTKPRSDEQVGMSSSDGSLCEAFSLLLQ